MKSAADFGVSEMILKGIVLARRIVMNRRRTLLFAVVLVAVASSGCGYNTLVSKQQNVREKWANIESQLQRRADLIPNTFEAARAASIQEQEVFGQIAEARSRLLNATHAAPQGENGDKTPEQKQAVIDAANSFGGTVGRLLSLAEAYPELRSTESFKKVQDAVEGTENRIAVAREDYNAAVKDYNTSRGQFPMAIAAKMYGFKDEPYFRAEEGAREAPKINADSVRRDQGGQSNANK
jgi:LemA protein